MFICVISVRFKELFLLNSRFLKSVRLSLTQRVTLSASLPGNYRQRKVNDFLSFPLFAKMLISLLYQVNVFLFDADQQSPLTLHQAAADSLARSLSVSSSVPLMTAATSVIYWGLPGAADLAACVIRGKLAVSHGDI